MSKNKQKQSEPSLRVAHFVSTKPDTTPSAPIALSPEVEPSPSLYFIKVDGLWMSSFFPLQTTEKQSEAIRLDNDSATVFARHIQFRKKGICEIIPA